MGLNLTEQQCDPALCQILLDLEQGPHLPQKKKGDSGADGVSNPENGDTQMDRTEIGKKAGGLSTEKVMADSLFKLAGELSLNAIHRTEKRGRSSISGEFE